MHSVSSLSFILAFLVAIVHCKTETKLVIDVIRHGARAPGSNSHFFPNITWKSHGELTPIGERQHYLLGRLRRHQYIESTSLLPKTFDPRLLYIRSSDVRRTLMSAQSYILGLYFDGLEEFNLNQTNHVNDLLAPPISLTVGNDLIKRLKNMPVPFNVPIPAIISVDHPAEKVLFSSSCPFIDEMAKKFFNEGEYRKLITEKHKSTWDKIRKEYPEITMDYLLKEKNAYSLADLIICANKEGRRPARLRPEVIEKLREFIGDIQRGEFTVDPMINKIGMSYFTKEVLDFMNKTIEGKGLVKYVLYSAHDVTEVIILTGLKRLNDTISFDKVPDFASNILFELNEEEDNKYYVVVYYDGNIIHKQNYEEFKVKFEKLGDMGMSWEKACRVSHSNLRHQWFNKLLLFEG
eukprot:TRINITY_DN88307_c0_g1_i1.p2 TRINITY_DN88307_c0_g1~~TRINITY_DN88307_c0_g1_i1.p2  ORF type:complete len:407 (-),score=37.19 TRINITY_DN88307_c0_g1_i1:50-1270(-)